MNFEIHEDCKKESNIDQIIVLTHYKNSVIKKLIKDAKFYKKKDILEDFSFYLSKLLLKYQKNIKKSDQLLIPVPMYFLRKWKR
jgi:predicted amidophosphoribosyltransferase